MVTVPQLFKSFWIAGYEGSTHINPAGLRLDMIAAAQHDVRAAEDYSLLNPFHFRTVRDAARWHLIDRGGEYDFSSFLPMLRAAIASGVQVIWDLCHYGWPDDVNLLSAAFVDRFAKYCKLIAELVRDNTDEIPFYSPVNEINFTTWGITQGLLLPAIRDQDAEIKRQFVRAAIAGSEAIRSVDPRTRFTFPEPVIHVVAPQSNPGLHLAAEQARQSQFEAWDMIGGYQEPQLGGKPEYLDILGANFYHSNEWELGGEKLLWHQQPRDERWRPLHQILAEVWERYHRPLYLAETSHVGSGRARWIQEIAQEVCTSWSLGVPLAGVCLYPILDRYDWGDASHWHNSGLWDLTSDEHGVLKRVVNPEYAEALLDAQRKLLDCP